MSTEEGQAEVRNKLLACIESGNIVVPKGVDESLFTKPGIVEDWKDESTLP